MKETTRAIGRPGRIQWWRTVGAACALVCGVSVAASQSLYDEQTFRSLTADNKAFRVGDLLTVQVFETSAASANADTDTRRSNGVSAGLTRAHAPPVAVGATVSSEFEGGGRTVRAGKLLAQLSVSVREVMPNGDLRIGGEQLLSINGEQQRINLEGRVRPQDISETNLVLSSRIADATITYMGEGDLAERQKAAWWRKALDMLGL